MRKRFSFIYPITKALVDLQRKGGWRFDHITDLIISGVGYANNVNPNDPIEEKYDFDIEEILFEGKNIYPVMDALDMTEQIENACFNHVHHLFTNQEPLYEIPSSSTAKLITLSLKRKIN